MSSVTDSVLKGPPVKEIPDLSMAEYLVPKIRSLPRDFVIEVEAETGASRTAGEFLAASIRLSEGLKKLGVRENDVVAMICKNSFEADEIVVGTWLCGAAITCFPGTLTIGEMKHILEISSPKLLFCEEEGFRNAKAALNLLSMSSKMILVGKNTKKSEDVYLTFQEVPVDVDVENYKPQPVKSPSTQLVAILSSSGTSGLPKGVGMTHKNLIFEAEVMKSMSAFNHKMDFLMISQFYWVTGILIFLASMTCGMKRVLLRDSSVPSILKAIDRYKAQASLMAPSLAVSLCTSPDFEKFDVSSMKMVIVGGSPFTPNIGQTLKEKWEGVTFLQCYGTTEICGSLTSFDGGDPYSVGRAVPGVQIKVVDVTTRKPLGPNTLGEIMAKTPSIMIGYVKNEEATREAMEDGWFRTGDLGYYDDSGHIYLVERLKEMIKVMNMQVSPTEVEDAILALPGVSETCVIGVSKGGSDQEVVALIVKEPNSNLTEDDVLAHVSRTLSDYKKPKGGVFFVESLPKTPSGKIQRREVRELAQSLRSKQ